MFKDTMKNLISVLLICLLASVAVGQDAKTKVEWNRFRGPNGSGVHLTSKAPLEWGDEQNVKWKCPLPGLGRSSPVVSENRVFLTAHSLVTKGNGGFEKYLLCIALDSGKLLWQKTIQRTHAKVDETYDKPNSSSGYAAHTPATDGEFVYASFGDDGLFAFDMDGEPVWHVSSKAKTELALPAASLYSSKRWRMSCAASVPDTR